MTSARNWPLPISTQRGGQDQDAPQCAPLALLQKLKRSAVPPMLVTLWVGGWVGGKGELEGVFVCWAVHLDVRVRWVGSGAQSVG